jgi:methionyl aminopeptidase
MIERNDLCWCGSGKKYKKCHLFEDQKNRASVKSAPRKNRLIKTDLEIEKMRKAGAFNGQLLDYIRPFVKAGISTEQLNTLILNIQ